MGCWNIPTVYLLSIFILAECSHATLTNDYIDVTILHNSTSKPSLFANIKRKSNQKIKIQYSVGERIRGNVQAAKLGYY